MDKSITEKLRKELGDALKSLYDNVNDYNVDLRDVATHVTATIPLMKHICKQIMGMDFVNTDTDDYIPMASVKNKEEKADETHIYTNPENVAPGTEEHPESECAQMLEKLKNKHERKNSHKYRVKGRFQKPEPKEHTTKEDKADGSVEDIKEAFGDFDENKLEPVDNDIKEDAKKQDAPGSEEPLYDIPEDGFETDMPEEPLYDIPEESDDEGLSYDISDELEEPLPDMPDDKEIPSETKAEEEGPLPDVSDELEEPLPDMPDEGLSSGTPKDGEDALSDIPSDNELNEELTSETPEDEPGEETFESSEGFGIPGDGLISEEAGHGMAEDGPDNESDNALNSLDFSNDGLFTQKKSENRPGYDSSDKPETVIPDDYKPYEKKYEPASVSEFPDEGFPEMFEQDEIMSDQYGWGLSGGVMNAGKQKPQEKAPEQEPVLSSDEADEKPKSSPNKRRRKRS